MDAATLVTLGTAAVAIAGGALLASIGIWAAAATALIALLLIGSSFPAVPFFILLGAFAAVSASPEENPGSSELAGLYTSSVSAFTPGDLLTAAAALCALGLFVSRRPEHPTAGWGTLGPPVVLLTAAGLLSSQVVHREGTDGLVALTPTMRFAIAFFVASLLLASRRVSGAAILRFFVAVGQLVAVVGIYNSVTGTATLGRSVLRDATGLTENASFYDSASAFVLVVAVLVALTRLLWAKRDQYVGYLLLMPLPLFALALSGRRAMYFALGLGILVVLAYSLRARRSLTAPALGFLLVVAGVTFLLAQSSAVYRERVTSIGSVFSQTADIAITDRQIETEVVLRNIRRSPLAGIGVAEPYTTYSAIRSAPPTYVHNTVLAIWLKFGLAGLLAFAWLVARTARAGHRAVADLVPSRQMTEPQAVLAIFASLAGLMSALLTASFLTASERIPVFTGVLLAAISTATIRTAEHQSPSSRGTAG